MRVLVTGHKGYIGAVMTPMIEAAGHTVVGLDSDFYRNSTYGVLNGVKHEILKDIRDIDKSDLEGIDAIVHLAGLSNDVLGELNEQLTYAINYHASVRLAELGREVGVRRFVFASSCSMYGAASPGDILNESADFNPVTAYAKSKVYVERDVSQMADDHFSPTFMRNATAYGMSPRIRFDLVVNNLTAWAYTTGSVRMKSDGTPWRPLVHIEDISTAVIAVLNAPHEKVHNQAYNVGQSAENYQVRDVAEMVKNVVDNCELSFANGASPDLRNYRVTFAKYERAFPDYPLTWTVQKGIEQLYNAYKAIGLGLDDYEGAKYKRIAQLEFLMENGLLGSDLHWLEAQPVRQVSLS
jgi:nucleoside-diphosphate-sugar epimerase